MTNFTTTIVAMYTLPQVNNETDVVVTAVWKVIGVEGAYTAEIVGNSQFTLLPDAPNFTPYSSLTQAQVVGWIPEYEIISAQQCVQGQINSMINPPVLPAAQSLPWAN